MEHSLLPTLNSQGQSRQRGRGPGRGRGGVTMPGPPGTFRARQALAEHRVGQASPRKAWGLVVRVQGSGSGWGGTRVSRLTSEFIFSKSCLLHMRCAKLCNVNISEITQFSSPVLANFCFSVCRRPQSMAGSALDLDL